VSERGRLAAAGLASGLLIAASVPPWGWWPLAFLGIAGFSRLLEGRDRRERALVGAAMAVGWFVPSVVWMIDFSVAGYILTIPLFGTAVVGAAVLTPPGTRRWLALPAALTLAELLRWHVPFGGAPLSTLAMSQADAPLAPVVRVAGPALLVALVVLIGVALDAVSRRAWRVGAAVVVCVVSVVGLAAVAPRGEAVGTIEVALVQGGGPQRTRAADTDEAEVFERHLAASEAIERPVDLVVWPENVVNVEGPVSDHPFGEDLSALARRFDAPVVVGAVEGEGDSFRNAALVIDADGRFRDRFEKIRRVPFGEYVPLRSLVEPVAGDALPSRDAIEGEGPAVIDTDVGRLGVVISWEVFFARRARDAIGNGGEILLNPTNGSSYWLTIVQTQQVASSRLRSLETGRWTLQASPTGFTAFVTPDGEVLDRTSISERAVVQGTVERRRGQTWATRVGHWPALLLALAVLVVAWRSRRPDPGHIEIGDGGERSGR